MSALFRLGSPQRPEALRAIEQRYARFVPAAVILGLLTSLCEGVGIGMLTPLLAALSGSVDQAGLPAFAVRLHRFAETVMPSRPIVPLLAIVLLFVLLKAATQIANASMIASVEQRAGDDIRRALADKMLALEYSFFLREDPARLVTIIDTDSWKVTEAVRVLLGGYAATAAAIVFAVLLVVTEWRLSLVVAIGVGLSRLAHYGLQRRLKRLGRAVVESNRVLGEQMFHAVRATRVIRVFGQERREALAFATLSGRVRDAMLRSERMAACSAPAIEIILAASILVVLLTLDGLGSGVPQAATFLVLLYRAQGPVLNASGAALRLASLHGSIAEVEWLLGIVAPTRATAMATARAVAPPPAEIAGLPIRFEGVCFGYDDAEGRGRPALNVVRLEFPPQTIVALSGASGSGKSTVINVLCRLLEPTAGRIEVGPYTLRDIDPGGWRDLIGLAGQDTDLITGTVAQNIAYGAPDASMEDIEWAAWIADAESFIERLPQGYATPLGAAGLGLSGGQRQRIGVARAVLRRPEILILDEATSAMDAASEARVIERLAQARPFGRAVIISHNPRMLTLCEFGIVLSAGSVVEAGPIGALYQSGKTMLRTHEAEAGEVSYD